VGYFNEIIVAFARKHAGKPKKSCARYEVSTAVIPTYSKTARRHNPEDLEMNQG
jgi:hypothetical protein